MNLISKIMLWCMLSLCTVSATAATDFNSNRTDFRDETIYFAMTTRFYDGDPKNNVLCWDGVKNQMDNGDPAWRGDFAGLIKKLDYIKALGFTAIWITPVVQNASGFDYHGYHAMDFSKVDLRLESQKAQGSAEDVTFQSLIKAAHDKGLKIVLDIVIQHTGNFGEENLQKLFTRNPKYKNQANINAAMIPDTEKLGADYLEQVSKQYDRRLAWMKNTDGQNKDSKNYWHHVGNGWNWDLVSRWWGQIAGDCVDLNTENPEVAQYIVDCYGKFIEMGVDAFRIDTTGHVARLTFNSFFIPKFKELGEKYANKRLNGAPFYMFGECCARFGGVIYRDNHALSSHFYTWQSPDNLVKEWQKVTAKDWAGVVVPEGAEPLLNMATCEKDVNFNESSDNVFMKNGQWHQPDYSKASGFNVIDFPMHYNFTNAGAAIGIAKDDRYYNDASFNVVYVDSHDYGPQPNDGIRFNGGTAQWAENLSLMFTFRGIPCIYYGSEVEFQKGVAIDKGPDLALINSGRAYFGAYLEGNVQATNFGEFTADGNVAKTLDGDLAQHIRRLNLIRQAVPALRKGQYTFDGCKANGGFAFKRAYKDSYALVAINGGATFENVPAGSYTDLVTGQKYSGGTITVNAPATQGQLRVLVKDWNGGKVGEDGKFIYSSSPVAHGGNPSFKDPGTTEYYKAEDATGSAAVKLSPAGGSFKTDTQTVTATLNEESQSGWYQIGNGSKVSLQKGVSSTFEIGKDMSYGQSVTVNWGATDADGKEFTGNVSYKKVDPNASITIYVTAPSAPNIYAWGKVDGKEVKFNGEWPGKQGQEIMIEGKKFWSVSCDTPDNSVSVIFSSGSGKTGDITGITEDTYFEYDGGSNAKKIDKPGPQKPVVVANPASGKKFYDSIKVSLSVSPETAIYYTTDGSSPSERSAKYTGPLTFTQTTTLKTYAKNSVGESIQTFTYTKTDAPQPSDEVAVYVEGLSAATIYVYNSTGQMTAWNACPPMTYDGETECLKYVIPAEYYNSNIIIRPSTGGQYPNGTGLQLSGKSMKLNWSDKSWTEFNGQPVPGDMFVLYFDNSSTQYSVPNIHFWSTTGGPATTWPGVSMTKLDGNIWKFSTHKDMSKVTGFMFCNNANPNNKTKEHSGAPVMSHLYTASGSYQDIDDKGVYIEPGSIENVAGDSDLNIRVVNNQLVVNSSKNTTMRLSHVSGTSVVRNIGIGENVIKDLSGVYIYGGKSYFLK